MNQTNLTPPWNENNRKKNSTHKNSIIKIVKLIQIRTENAIHIKSKVTHTLPYEKKKKKNIVFNIFNCGLFIPEYLCFIFQFHQIYSQKKIILLTYYPLKYNCEII